MQDERSPVTSTSNWVGAVAMAFPFAKRPIAGIPAD